MISKLSLTEHTGNGFYRKFKMTDNVEMRIYKNEDGVEITSFVPVEKPGFWDRLKNFIFDHHVRPYIKVTDLNNSNADNGNTPKPAIEGGIKLTF